MIKLAVSIGTLEVGGAETFVINLLKNLDYQRFKVVLIVLGKKTGSFLEREAEKLPINISYISKKEGFRPSAILKIWLILKRFKPDILHGNIGGLLYFLPYLFFHRIKLIYTAHTLADKEFGCFKRYLIGKFIKRGKIIAVGISPEIRNSLASTYKFNLSNIPLILNGIDVDKYYHRKDFSGKITIGHVGRFEAVKNHRTIINVFLSLKKDYPDLTLRLIGEGSLFLNYLEEFKHNEDIIFVGKSENVQEELKQIHLFLIPSFYEGLPLAVLEAMASGCVIVGSNVGGLKDLIEEGKNGYLLNDPRDVVGFSEAIDNLLKNRELMLSMSFNNIQKVQDYDIKKTAKSYQKLYMLEAKNVKRGI